MQIHPLAELFPPLSHDELLALRDDIQANGLRDPIVTYEGQVLDGRHRLRACEIAKVEPRFEELPAGVDPLAFAMSRNVFRRHLNTAQRAIIAARIANLGEGRPSQTAGTPAVSQLDAARQLGTSRDAVQQAVRVLKQGADELIDAAQAGQISLNAAATICEQPKRDQRRELASLTCKSRRPKPKPRQRKTSSPDQPGSVPSAPPVFRTFAFRLSDLFADEFEFITKSELSTVAEWTPVERADAVRVLTELRDRVQQLLDAVKGATS